MKDFKSQLTDASVVNIFNEETCARDCSGRKSVFTFFCLALFSKIVASGHFKALDQAITSFFIVTAGKIIPVQFSSMSSNFANPFPIQNFSTLSL